MSRKRSRSFSIHDSDEQQPSPSKKVRIDLTRNITHEPDSEQESKSTPSPETSTPSQATVTFEEHDPGVNDFMSGCVLSPSPRHRRRSFSTASDDATVASSDIFLAVHSMPFKILSLKDLPELDLFDRRFPSEVFPVSFTTTILGVCRAVEDARHVMQSEDTGRLTWDDALVGALAKRGGYFPEEKDVEYVEDMVPLVEEEEADCFDGEYWGMIANQGTIWRATGMADEDEDGDQEGMEGIL